MILLTESKHYKVYHEYENVILEIKESQKRILIGDFYGNPQMAVISEYEKFCVMCGCGIIVYYLKEPFKEYEYHVQTEQWREWREWGRNGEEMWVEGIESVNGKTVVCLSEAGENIVLDI